MDTHPGTYRKHIEVLLTVGTVFVALLSIFLLILIIDSVRGGGFMGADTEPHATITVSGEGSVFAIPDVAEFTFSVQSEAEQVPDAQSEVARRMEEITAFLKGEGIEERHIQTQNYSVWPRYEFREPAVATPSDRGGVTPRPPQSERVLVGYEVMHTTKVTVTEMDDAGRLVGGVGERGATNVSNVVFSVEDEKVLKQEARALAIEEAKREAETLSRDLNVRLVRIVRFQESRTPTSPGMRMEMAEAQDAAAPAPAFDPGEEEIVSEVQVTYEIR